MPLFSYFFYKQPVFIKQNYVNLKKNLHFLVQRRFPLPPIFIYIHKLWQNESLPLTFNAGCIMIFRSEGARLALFLCDLRRIFL